MQLSDYLSENRLIYEFQYGFRLSYSTDVGVIQPTEYIKLVDDKESFHMYGSARFTESF